MSNDNPFENLTYVIVDLESIPSGLDNLGKRSCRKHVNGNVAKQNEAQSHLNTWTRKDIPTLFEVLPNGEKGELIQTANKFILRVDARGYADEQELVDDIKLKISEDTGWPFGIIETKVEIIVVGGQQAVLAYLAAHKEAWGEG